MWRFSLLAVLLAANACAQPSLDAMVDREMPSLVANYKILHAAPELSHHEEKTSAFVAKELRSMGYDVSDHVGKYDQPQWTGYGVVGVLRNGRGPTVLVRTELDALPVEENTGLPYASKARGRNDAGEEVRVMHACGHDIHMASLLGAAKMLAQLKNRWRGTLVLIGQPAEETIDGAQGDAQRRAVCKIPQTGLRAGAARFEHSGGGEGRALRGVCPGRRHDPGRDHPRRRRTRIPAGVDKGPHCRRGPVHPGAANHRQPGDFAARSRGRDGRFDPRRHAANIIPDEVKMQLTVRTYKEEVRQKILASIGRMAKNIALAAGIPAERAPLVRVVRDSPATYNDPALTRRLTGAMEKTLGPDHVVKQPPVMASEDFCRYGLEGSGHSDLLFLARGRRSRGSGEERANRNSAAVAPFQLVCAASRAHHPHGRQGNDVRRAGTDETIAGEGTADGHFGHFGIRVNHPLLLYLTFQSGRREPCFQRPPARRWRKRQSSANTSALKALDRGVEFLEGRLVEGPVRPQGEQRPQGERRAAQGTLQLHHRQAGCRLPVGIVRAERLGQSAQHVAGAAQQDVPVAARRLCGPGLGQQLVQPQHQVHHPLLERMTRAAASEVPVLVFLVAGSRAGFPSTARPLPPLRLELLHPAVGRSDSAGPPAGPRPFPRASPRRRPRRSRRRGPGALRSPDARAPASAGSP